MKSEFIISNDISYSTFFFRNLFTYENNNSMEKYAIKYETYTINA